jgi:hypothetical protein
MPRSGVRARSTTTDPEALLYAFDDGTLGDINSRAAAGGVTRQLITSSNSFLVAICLRLAAGLYSTNGTAGRVSGRPAAVRLHCERPRMRSCALVTGDTQFILAAASSNRRAECRFIVAMLGLTACTGASQPDAARANCNAATRRYVVLHGYRERLFGAAVHNAGQSAGRCRAVKRPAVPLDRSLTRRAARLGIGGAAKLRRATGGRVPSSGARCGPHGPLLLPKPSFQNDLRAWLPCGRNHRGPS